MSLTWSEIDTVLSELDLVGSHVQQIVQPDFRNLMFRIYRPAEKFWLRICLETGRTRIHRHTGSVEKPRTRQRFNQLLSSRIKGGRIVSATQVGRDRIIRLEVTSAGLSTVLWIRLWGGAANVVVTETDRTIVDAFFRRPKRGEVTGATFRTPDPRAETPEPENRFAVPPGTHPDANERIERHYAELSEQSETTALRDSLNRDASRRRDRIARQIESATGRLSQSREADRLRICGDLIRSNLAAVKPGDRWLEAEDYSEDGSLVTIELDPDRSPIENADRYYARSKAARRKLAAIEDEVRNLEVRLALADDRLNLIAAADLAELRNLSQESRQGRTPAGSTQTTPGLAFASGGFTILVGRSSRENDELLRHHVRGNDVWLHTRDCPGGYVFIRAQRSKSVPLDVLLDAGNLAVHFSKARQAGNAELYYTQVKHLRRARNGPAGLVLPTQEKNLSISVDADRLARLRA
jgi:predicted ribosome quality control (RQC) complex YloA/Tae2 family protein